MVYCSTSELDFRLADLPSVPRPQRVLLASPQHFDVEYVINPHMEGQIGNVDRDKATRQWESLRQAYEHAGVETLTVEGAPGLPDMVFCANQTLPYLVPNGKQRGVILSRMHAPQRRDEVAHFETFFQREGYVIHHLQDLNTDFEGMGDAIWHPGRYLLWGGYGFRTDLGAYELISEMLNVPVLALRLEDPDFYHLDTCLSVLDARSALIYPGAFQQEGLDLLMHFFDHLIEAPEDEARNLFACNAHCPDERHVLIQQGCADTSDRLLKAGFTPVELDTSEFLKAGGSVFCMKQMFW